MKPVLGTGSMFVRSVENEEELAEHFEFFLKGAWEQFAYDPLHQTAQREYEGGCCWRSSCPAPRSVWSRSSTTASRTLSPSTTSRCPPDPRSRRSTRARPPGCPRPSWTRSRRRPGLCTARWASPPAPPMWSSGCAATPSRSSWKQRPAWAAVPSTGRCCCPPVSTWSKPSLTWRADSPPCRTQGEGHTGRLLEHLRRAGRRLHRSRRTRRGTRRPARRRGRDLQVARRPPPRPSADLPRARSPHLHRGRRERTRPGLP